MNKYIKRKQMIDIKNLKVNIENKALEAKNIIIVLHNGIEFDAIGPALGISFFLQK